VRGADAAPATRAQLFPISSLAFDGAGRLHIGNTSRWSASRVQVVGPPSSLIRLLEDEDRIFADADGKGYILSSAGRHIRTVDLKTAVVLKEFIYDDQGRLSAIIDRFGEIDFDTDEIQYVPKGSTPISGDDIELMEKFVEMLNDVDDVQNVYSNLKMSEEALAALEAE